MGSNPTLTARLETYKAPIIGALSFLPFAIPSEVPSTFSAHAAVRSMAAWKCTATSHHPIGQLPLAPPAAEPAGLLPGLPVPLPPDVPISPAAAPLSGLTFPLAPRSRMGSTGVSVVVDLPGSTVDLPGPVVVIGLSLLPGCVTPGLGAPPLGACPGCFARVPTEVFGLAEPAAPGWAAEPLDTPGSRMALISSPIRWRFSSISAPIWSRSCCRVMLSSSAFAAPEAIRANSIAGTLSLFMVSLHSWCPFYGQRKPRSCARVNDRPLS